MEGAVFDASPTSKRVDDRIRTGDRLDHNQELYQLSYVHRAGSNLAGFDEFGEGAEAGGRAWQEVGFEVFGLGGQEA